MNTFATGTPSMQGCAPAISVCRVASHTKVAEVTYYVLIECVLVLHVPKKAGQVWLLGKGTT